MQQGLYQRTSKPNR